MVITILKECRKSYVVKIDEDGTEWISLVLELDFPLRCFFFFFFFFSSKGIKSQILFSPWGAMQAKE